MSLPLPDAPLQDGIPSFPFVLYSHAAVRETVVFPDPHMSTTHAPTFLSALLCYFEHVFASGSLQMHMFIDRLPTETVVFAAILLAPKNSLQNR